MGWASCGRDGLGRDIGYDVEATCDEPGCEATIDRGLAHLCGQMHMDGNSCNRYFCPGHLYAGASGQRCRRCLDEEEVLEVMES